MRFEKWVIIFLLMNVVNMAYMLGLKRWLVDMTQYVQAKASFSTDKEVDTTSPYLLWLQKERNASLNLTFDQEPLISYRAMAGLGHQLARLSSAYHLAFMYKLPYLQVTANPVCGGDIFTIYNYLIGPGLIMVDVPAEFAPSSTNLFQRRDLFPLLSTWPNMTMTNNETNVERNVININNDVPGYERIMSSSVKYGSKYLTDYQLFHQLFLLFEQRHKQRIEKNFNKTLFGNHTVFGLHVRTGNGEKGDFTVKKREIENIEQWIVSVMDMFCEYSKSHVKIFQKKPLMIYVGTDTGSVVEMLRNASHCNIPVVSSEQTYPQEGKSVSFLQKYKDDKSCLKSWEDMFLDMYIFTKCESVVAGTYSSFTQTAPLSFVMEKAKKRPEGHHYFCEVGKRGDRLDCFDDIFEWIYRKPAFAFGNESSLKQHVIIEASHPTNMLRSDEALTNIFQGTRMMEIPREYLQGRTSQFQ